MPPASDALVLTNRHTGETLALRRIARGGEVWLELKGSLPPHREGPPLHVHVFEDEEGHVVAGTLSAVVDGRTIQVPAGQPAAFPKGSVHRWWNASNERLVFEGYVKPVVDLDAYLQSAFDVLNEGPAARPPLFYMAHLAWRHRRTQQVRGAPTWVQAMLFPAIVGLGTLLGRYRGDQWPGCPTKVRAVPMAADA
jgi:quercetin dioxygenase-like cupin family protein